MFVRDDDNSAILAPFSLQQLKHIGDSADISRVRMQQVLRPVLGFMPVVTKRTDDLELKCPLIRYLKRLALGKFFTEE